MLIGGDDIGNDFITLCACFHVFFNVCLHSRSFPLRADWRKSDSSVDGEPPGHWRRNSYPRGVVASCPSFSLPAASAHWRACSQSTYAQFKGVMSRYLLFFLKSQNFWGISWIPKEMVQFCLLRLYCRHWNWMARTNKNWNCKKIGQLFRLNYCACKNHPKIYYVQCSLVKSAVWRLHNSTGAFCVWVKVLSDDFSRELT